MYIYVYVFLQVEFTSEKVESGWDDEEQEDFWG